MQLTKIGSNGKTLAKTSKVAAVALLDENTGLMWAANDSAPRGLNHAAATKAAQETQLAGFSDWRLPTIDELETLRDRARYRPAADPQLGLKSDWYWSSSPGASSPEDYAWVVYFGNGDSFCYHRDSYAFVRAVRSAAPASAGQ